MPTATEGVVNWLTARKKDHPAPDLLERFLKYGCDLEVQVNVAQGNGEPVDGKRSTFTDGIDEWFSYRIPKAAYGDPHFRDFPLRFPLDSQCSQIGSTGWDWKAKRSRWVGFDFDSIAGHAAGVGRDDATLAKVREAAIALPYVEARHSTGGTGLHLYVVCADHPSFDCKNHTQHAAIARGILAKMSRDAGFDFAADVDGCGGNMWLWRRNMPDNGLTLIKAGELLATAPSYDIPAVVPVSTSGDIWDQLSQSYMKTPRGPLHTKIIDQLAALHVVAEWDTGAHCLKTHSMGLHRINADFAPHSDGTDLSTPNCYCFPTANGFTVKWYGRDLSAEFRLRQQSPLTLVKATELNSLA